MFFTREDFKKIEEYLKLNSKRDTDFARVRAVTKNDTTVIVQGTENKSIKVSDLVSTGMQDKSVTIDKLSDDVVGRFTQNEETSEELRNQLIEIAKNLSKNLVHVVLSQSQYEGLEHKDKSTIYLIVDKEWTFGNRFPIVLSGEWNFEEQFPIILT